MSAAFELLGSADHGRLSLTSPLGTTLAEVQWTTLDAQWRTATETRHFASMDQLTEQLLGTSLPLAALFDWLQARPTSALGWEADLQDLPQGRLRAQRTHPAPQAQLRIVLEP
jgi:outer membrane lipoprotein LolB